MPVLKAGRRVAALAAAFALSGVIAFSPSVEKVHIAAIEPRHATAPRHATTAAVVRMRRPDYRTRFMREWIHRQHKRRRSSGRPRKRSAALQHQGVTFDLVEALRLTREPMSWLSWLKLLASRESSDNPRAVGYESVAGAHAEGLMQMLPSTFVAHALPHRANIWNPVDNAVAAIRYIAGRYGSPARIPGLATGDYEGY